MDFAEIHVRIRVRGLFFGAMSNGDDIQHTVSVRDAPAFYEKRLHLILPRLLSDESVSRWNQDRV